MSADWDIPLTGREIKKLAPKDRRQRALVSLERKIELLKTRASRVHPAPATEDFPVSRAALRRWEDHEVKLWAWTDPGIDAPRGRNAALMAEFELLSRRHREGVRSGRISLTFAETYGRLMGQIAQQHEANQKLAVSLRMANDACAHARAETDDVRLQFGRLTRLLEAREHGGGPASRES